mgnify:CR=1 FL=1
MMISDNFDIDDDEEQIIVGYINNIREKMPIWKKGGRINWNFYTLLFLFIYNIINEINLLSI